VILWNKGEKTEKEIRSIKHATQITPTELQAVEIAGDRKIGSFFSWLGTNVLILNNSSLVPTAQRAPWCSRHIGRYECNISKQIQKWSTISGQRDSFRSFTVGHGRNLSRRSAFERWEALPKILRHEQTKRIEPCWKKPHLSCARRGHSSSRLRARDHRRHSRPRRLLLPWHHPLLPPAATSPRTRPRARTRCSSCWRSSSSPPAPAPLWAARQIAWPRRRRSGRGRCASCGRCCCSASTAASSSPAGGIWYVQRARTRGLRTCDEQRATSVPNAKPCALGCSLFSPFRGDYIFGSAICI